MKEKRIELINAVSQKLISLAEKAHSLRRLDTVEQIGQTLSDISEFPEYQSVGMYFSSLSFQQNGRGDLIKSRALQEQVVEHGPVRFKARALLALGGITTDLKDYESGLMFYKEASRASLANDWCDPYTTLQAQRMIAVIQSIYGDHDAALNNLENLFSLARVIAPHSPATYFDYLNSLAVELSEAGRLEEASNISQIVIASPLASAYPEWRETPDEIAKRGRRASRSVVALSNLVVPSNIVPFSAENTDGSADPPHVQNENEKAPVFQISEWTGRMAKNTQSKPKEKTTRQVEDMDRAQRQTEIMRHILDENTSDQDLADFLKYIDSKRSANKEGTEK